MSALTLDDFPVGEWRRHDTARCPACDKPLELRRYLKAKEIGTFSLAGGQMKVAALMLWEYRCRACGAAGSATLKADAASVVSGQTSTEEGE